MIMHHSKILFEVKFTICLASNLKNFLKHLIKSFKLYHLYSKGFFNPIIFMYEYEIYRFNLSPIPLSLNSNFFKTGDKFVLA